MQINFGKLILASITDNDENAGADAVGFLVLENGILPVKLWANEDDAYGCILGGAAFSAPGKDAEKLYYINVYRPKNEESRYAYSALIKPVSDPKDKSLQLRSFLYRDFNVSNFFQGALFDNEDKSADEAAPTPAKKGSKGKSRLF